MLRLLMRCAMALLWRPSTPSPSHRLMAPAPGPDSIPIVGSWRYHQWLLRNLDTSPQAFEIAAHHLDDCFTISHHHPHHLFDDTHR